MLNVESVKGIISWKLYNARTEATSTLLHLGEKRKTEEPDEELDEEYEDEYEEDEYEEDEEDNEEEEDEEDEEDGDMMKKLRKQAMKIIKDRDFVDKDSEDKDEECVMIKIPHFVKFRNSDRSL